MPLSPSHLAAKMGEGALGRIGALSSTVSFGCYAPALPGVTYLSVIPPIRRATADFSNGCGRASCEVFSKHSLKICGFKAGLDVREAFIDGSFAPAKKGDRRLAKQNVARERR